MRCDILTVLALTKFVYGSFPLIKPIAIFIFIKNLNYEVSHPFHDFQRSFVNQNMLYNKTL